jgi:hypothetical protein
VRESIEYRFRVPSVTVFTLYLYSKAVEYRFRVSTAGSLKATFVTRAASNSAHIYRISVSRIRLDTYPKSWVRPGYVSRSIRGVSVYGIQAPSLDIKLQPFLAAMFFHLISIFSIIGIPSTHIYCYIWISHSFIDYN